MQKPINANMSISAAAATASARPVAFIPRGVNSSRVSNKKEATRLGRLVQERMAALGMRRQAELVREGLSPTTVSRIIWEDGFAPHVPTLAVLADALGLDRDELVLFVYGGTQPAGETLDPILVEAHKMLAPGSPLTDDEREHLRGIFRAGMSFYTGKMAAAARRARKSA